MELTLSVTCVDTDDLLKVTIALGEFVVLGCAGHVVGAADEIVPVLAVVGTVDRVEARLEAELVSADKSTLFHDRSALYVFG